MNLFKWFTGSEELKGAPEGALRIVSEPEGTGRRWYVEINRRYIGWCYEKTTTDEAIAKEWMQNLKSGKNYKRIEFTEGDA